jgi:hypothetical protein
MNQATRVLDYLKEKRTLTSFEAFTELGITRLAARVFELNEEGHSIKKNTIKKINKWGEKMSFAEYYYDEKGEDND